MDSVTFSWKATFVNLGVMVSSFSDNDRASASRPEGKAITVAKWDGSVTETGMLTGTGVGSGGGAAGVGGAGVLTMGGGAAGSGMGVGGSGIGAGAGAAGAGV